jgi:hypothetical protein
MSFYNLCGIGSQHSNISKGKREEGGTYKNHWYTRLLQGSHYFQIRGRSDLSFRELTGRSGETSGKSQLRLIETLFHYPSDVILCPNDKLKNMLM